MIKTTRDQRLAIHRKWQISPQAPYITPLEQSQGVTAVPFTYKQFRRTVHATFGCDGAVTVYWCGMWLCIERDGYTHS